MIPRFMAPFIAFLFISASQASACFTIVVGKDACASGYVIMAHNEDDGPPQIVNHYKVSREKHKPGEKVKLLGGGELDQVPETWAYIWSEMPGLLFSDSFLNEWGVCITSDNCPSREDKAQLTDGGISWDLRRLVAQRAKSAREGVHMAAQLVERFGYDHSGRTYIISDPNEGWFFCVVHGKHWLAARVPDDQVAMVANTFSVHAVNLEDTLNYLAAKDIIKYARSRGWYDPKRDGQFDFAGVYSSPDAASDSSNFCRQWGGLRSVCAEAIPLGHLLPFSVVPKQELDATAVMEVLRDHYDWTELYRTDPQNNSPHQPYINTICNWTTQTSFVAELRADLPPEIGLVYWVALGPPCTSVYIPYYFGISEFPAGYSESDPRAARDLYLEMISAPFQADAVHAFWTFSNFHHKVYGNYGVLGADSKAMVEKFERHALMLKGPMEEAALATYVMDKETAMKMLENYSAGLCLKALDDMSRLNGKE